MAARTFVGAFAGATVDDPVRLLSRVDEVLAWLSDVDVGLLGGPDRRPWELLQPSVLETLCVGQVARVVAARSVDGVERR